MPCGRPAWRLRVIEDAAQAHGARYQGRRAGSPGTAAGFSFYPGKNLGALGDGGAVTTDDDELAARVRLAAQLRLHGQVQARGQGASTRGSDEMQAAVLRAKLPGLDADNAARAQVAVWYGEALGLDLVLPGGARAPSLRGTSMSCAARAAARPLQAAPHRRGIGHLVHYPGSLAISKAAYAETHRPPLPLPSSSSTRC